MAINALLTVEHISKTYEGRPLLRDISFDVAAGEIVCLLGPSGTGKTTLLRIIAGLEEADTGQVLFDGKNLRGVPPHERGFGMMFQDLALFPHRNVFDNVAFGLRMQNANAHDITTRVHEALELVGLEAMRFAPRDVNRLSGGEQQRVALARTIAPRPRLVMFDEPLGALDRILREELVIDLRALLKRLRMTALYVTHDQDEAFAIADRLILLNAGHIEQSGTPIELYQHPANVFVARFMGLTNLIEIQTLEQKESETRAKTTLGDFRVAAHRASKQAQVVLFRPQAVEKIVEKSARTENVLCGTLTETQWRGGHQRIVLNAGNKEFGFEWNSAVKAGQNVALELNTNEIDFLTE